MDLGSLGVFDPDDQDDNDDPDDHEDPDENSQRSGNSQRSENSQRSGNIQRSENSQRSENGQRSENSQRSDEQGLTGRVFQLRVGYGSGIGKKFRVGSGMDWVRVFASCKEPIGYYRVLKNLIGYFLGISSM